MSINMFPRRIDRRIEMKDPIVEEVREARRKHAEKFNFDLHVICEDLKNKMVGNFFIIDLVRVFLWEATKYDHRLATSLLSGEALEKVRR